MIKKEKSFFQPNYAIPPGETLKEVLEFIGMSQSQLAERAGRPKKTINEIIAGKATITAETAIQLERVLGIPAHFWSNLECNYQEIMARIEDKKLLETQIEWMKRFPLNALAKNGWLPKERSPVNQLESLLQLFGVAGVEEWNLFWDSPQAVFRASAAFKKNPYSVASWLRQGEIEAQKIICGTYRDDSFKAALQQIRNLIPKFSTRIEIEMKKLCADAGVALVFLPELPHLHIFGASRWLNQNKAIIQLSLRGKSDDHFWFSFFHEAGHLLLHGKKNAFIDEEICSKKNRWEEGANKFAANILITPKIFREFIGRNEFGELEIQRFAREINVAPGIVVGRLQHDRLIPFNRGNSLKRKIQFRSERI